MKKIIPMLMLYTTSMFFGCSEKKEMKEISVNYKNVTITKNVDEDYVISDKGNEEYFLIKNHTAFETEIEGMPSKELVVGNIESNLKKMANPDSVDMLIKEFNWAKNYKSRFDWYSKHLMIKPDTLIRNTVDAPIALSDLDEDGNYDVVQYVGGSPGSSGVIMTEKALNTYLLRNHVRIVKKSKFESVLGVLK